MPYLLVGMAVRFWLFNKPFYVLVCSIAIALLMLLTPIRGIDALYDYGIAISVSTAIVSALALLSRYISYAWLTLIGQASMAIYVSHTIVSALLRALLTSIDIRDVAVHLFLGVALGIIVPLIAFFIIRKNDRALKIVGW